MQDIHIRHVGGFFSGGSRATLRELFTDGQLLGASTALDRQSSTSAIGNDADKEHRGNGSQVVGVGDLGFLLDETPERFTKKRCWTDRLLAGPGPFRRYLPFGQCTERAVLVGDQHGDAHGYRKFSVFRRKLVSGLRGAGVPTLFGRNMIG